MPTLKIACINVWKGGVVWDNLLKFIHDTDADMLLLQEVFNSHDPAVPKRFRAMDEFIAEFKYPYHALAPAFVDTEDGITAEQGNAIFSKFPIVDHDWSFYHGTYSARTEQTPDSYKVTPRNVQHATIDVDGTLLHAFNNHGVWEVHGGDTPERLKMGRHIAEAVHGKSHVILGGDFNVNPNTETIRLIEKELQPVFGEEIKTTFNLKYKTDPGFATAVVDLLFVSSDIKII